MELKPRKKSRDKGFSLFTPLVGTSVLIIALLMSVTMMQNSARVSESLSNSLLASDQAIDAKYIKSSARSLIRQKMKESINQGLEEIDTRCSEDCESAVKSDLTADIDYKGETNIKQAFQEVVAFFPRYSVPTGTTREIGKVINDFSAVKTKFQGKEVNISLNRQGFENHEETFTITFISEDGDKEIEVNVIPEDVSVRTSSGIEEKIEIASSMYDGTDDWADYGFCDNDGEDAKYYKDDQSWKVGEFTFKVSGGKEMTVLLHSGDYTAPPSGEDWDKTQSC